MSDEFFAANRIGVLEGENRRLAARVADLLAQREKLWAERRELKRKLRKRAAK